MLNRLHILFIGLLVAMSSVVNAASYHEGEAAFKAKEYKKAVAIWQQLAKQGDTASQISLAQMHTIGLGVEKNLQTAFKLYLKAAKSGSAEAQNQLGKMYITAQGVNRDPIESRKWFLKAAEQGSAEAIYNYGVSYFKGEGITTDYVQAHAWMHVAVMKGYDSAIIYRDQLAEVLSKEKLKKSSQISSRLFKQLENKTKLKSH